MKKLLIIFFILGISNDSFCQDSSLYKNSWQIEGGESMLIPIRTYNVETNLNNNCADCIYSKFKVTPRFTATNFFINTNYYHTLHSFKKSHLGVKMSIGYQHYEIKDKSEGYYGGGFAGLYFKGTITSTKKYDYLNLDLAFSYTQRIMKKLYLTNELGVTTYLLFHKLYKDKYNSFSNDSTWEHRYNTWKNKYNKIGLLLEYRLGFLILLNKHFSITPKVEIPLLVINSIWKKYDGGIKSYSLSPYLTSINNISFINSGITITYKIK